MKILMLDLETAPNRVYTWGLWNQNISLSQIEESGYTLCWAAKWLNKNEIHYSSLRDGKKEMLLTIYDMIDQADIVIHYNGTKFDMPILNQEFISMGWSPPSPVIEVDLLKVVRKRFRLTSNKLDYVANYLGLGGKLKHKGMSLWRDVMANDPSAWVIMENYNKQDIKLLEKLYLRLIPWISNHPNYGLFLNNKEKTCPNCGSTSLQKRGKSYTNTLTYQRYRCNDCGSWSKDRYTNLDKNLRANIVKGM